MGPFILPANAVGLTEAEAVGFTEAVGVSPVLVNWSRVVISVFVSTFCVCARSVDLCSSCNHGYNGLYYPTC